VGVRERDGGVAVGVCRPVLLGLLVSGDAVPDHVRVFDCEDDPDLLPDGDGVCV